MLPGVHIGSGAIIGACSVVTKDIPPYAVAAGNPARVVRMRFEPETVEFLLRLCWWDKPAQEITELLPYLCSCDGSGLRRLRERYPV